MTHTALADFLASSFPLCFSLRTTNIFWASMMFQTQPWGCRGNGKRKRTGSLCSWNLAAFIVWLWGSGMGKRGELSLLLPLLTNWWGRAFSHLVQGRNGTCSLFLHLCSGPLLSQCVSSGLSTNVLDPAVSALSGWQRTPRCSNSQKLLRKSMLLVSPHYAFLSVAWATRVS